MPRRFLDGVDVARPIPDVLCECAAARGDAFNHASQTSLEDLRECGLVVPCPRASANKVGMRIASHVQGSTRAACPIGFASPPMSRGACPIGLASCRVLLAMCRTCAERVLTCAEESSKVVPLTFGAAHGGSARHVPSWL